MLSRSPGQERVPRCADQCRIWRPGLAYEHDMTGSNGSRSRSTPHSVRHRHLSAKAVHRDRPSLQGDASPRSRDLRHEDLVHHLLAGHASRYRSTTNPDEAVSDPWLPRLAPRAHRRPGSQLCSQRIVKRISSACRDHSSPHAAHRHPAERPPPPPDQLRRVRHPPPAATSCSVVSSDATASKALEPLHDRTGAKRPPRPPKATSLQLDSPACWRAIIVRHTAGWTSAATPRRPLACAFRPVPPPNLNVTPSASTPTTRRRIIPTT